jgi:hypothetical protein
MVSKDDLDAITSSLSQIYLERAVSLHASAKVSRDAGNEREALDFFREAIYYYESAKQYDLAADACMDAGLKARAMDDFVLAGSYGRAATLAEELGFCDLASQYWKMSRTKNSN